MLMRRSLPMSTMGPFLLWVGKGRSWTKIQEAILKIDPKADIGSNKKIPTNPALQVADGYGGPKTAAWLKGAWHLRCLST